MEFEKAIKDCIAEEVTKQLANRAVASKGFVLSEIVEASKPMRASLESARKQINKLFCMVRQKNVSPEEIDEAQGEKPYQQPLPFHCVNNRWLYLLYEKTLLIGVYVSERDAYNAAQSRPDPKSCLYYEVDLQRCNAGTTLSTFTR